ncbi:MAG: FtsX-like permease family protein [Actinomycetaceae bacterium]|nr:FtsX-like permease family protein [Actinomycetaceae bacterium]
MWELIRSNVLVHTKRYIASSVAIVIAVAFILVCLLLGVQNRVIVEANFEQSFHNVSVQISHASSPDNTVEGVKEPSGPEKQGQVLGIKKSQYAPDYSASDVMAYLRTIAGVKAVSAQMETYSNVSAKGAKHLVQLNLLQQKPFNQPVVVSGRLPAGEGEVLLDEDVAKNMTMGIGDTFRPQHSQIDLKIVGLGRNANPASINGATVLTQDSMEKATGSLSYRSLVVSAPEVDQKQLKHDVEQALVDFTGSKDVFDQVEVKTYDEAKKIAEKEGKQMQQALFVVLITFPVIALVVAIIVISTTFQVVMSRREKEFGLLRCIGMTTQGIKRMVAVESLIVGAISSLIGVVVGIVLQSVSLTYFGFVASVKALPRFFPLWLIGVAWLVGVVMTLLAARASMRRSAKITPMAALSTAEAFVPRQRTKRRWLAVAGIVTTLAGAAGIALGMLKGKETGFLVSLGSGVFALVGVLMIAMVSVPTMIYGVTRLRARRSMLWDIAGTNARAFAGRTGATAVALIMGVTLCSMIIVGRSSLETTSLEALDKELPIDLIVEAPMDEDAQAEGTAESDDGDSQGSVVEGFSQEDLATIKDLDNVEKIHPVRMVPVRLGPKKILSYEVVERDDLADVAHHHLEPIDDDVMIINKQMEQDLASPTKVTVSMNSDGAVVHGGSFADKENSADTPAVSDVKTKENTYEVTLKKQKLDDFSYVFVNPQTMDKIIGSHTKAPIRRVYVRVKQDLTPQETLSLTAQMEEKLPNASITGAVVKRAVLVKTLDTMMIVVLVLLGVAVLVALVGVGNTMALSVAQRRNETGLLRALGLTKRQTKQMLLIEACVIAGISVVIGIVLGSIFGIVGLYSLPLDNIGQRVVDIPWQMLGLVVIIGILAALIATALPARTAAKVSPIEAIEAP